MQTRIRKFLLWLGGWGLVSLFFTFAHYFAYSWVGEAPSVWIALRNELEAKLDPRQFLRIHRPTIVNRQRVKELQPHSHGDYLCPCGAAVAHLISHL